MSEKTLLYFASVFCPDEADYLRLAAETTNPDFIRALAQNVEARNCRCTREIWQIYRKMTS